MAKRSGFFILSSRVHLVCEGEGRGKSSELRSYVKDKGKKGEEINKLWRATDHITRNPDVVLGRIRLSEGCTLRRTADCISSPPRHSTWLILNNKNLSDLSEPFPAKDCSSISACLLINPTLSYWIVFRGSSCAVINTRTGKCDGYIHGSIRRDFDR